MDFLNYIDTAVFIWINHLPHTALLNGAAQTISGIGYGGGIFILLGIFLIFREEKRDHWFFLPMGTVSLLCFILSEIVFKIGFLRPRPDILPYAIIVGQSPDSFSFPSTHAAVAFAFAVLLSWKEPKWEVWLFILAILIGFSRIYLGHHYPLDVLAGALLGLCIGFFVLRVFEKRTRKISGRGIRRFLKRKANK